ncbi:S9 family peptidase [Caenimonas sedimenti]|nr:S9 family peptidase [Caenimonas sedimenti]
MQPFTVDDLYLHQKISEIHCTEAPTLAACTVRSVDRESNTYISRIWGYALDGSAAAQQLTHGPGNDQSPRWSPQGDQLAFISDRGGTSQVYLLPRHGGEARQLGQFSGAVSSLRWAADGKTLIVAAAVQVDPDWRGQRANGREPAQRNESAPEVAWRLPYKSDGMGYMLAREIHLFSLEVATGKTRQITDGPFDVMAFGVSFSGDIAYVRTREGRFAHRTDLWRCSMDGSGQRRLTTSLAMVLEPVWSPDGKSIAFSGSEKEGDAQENLWLVDPTGRLRRLGDESLCLADPLTLYWHPDGQSLLFAEAHRGCHRIVKLRLDARKPEVLVDGDVQFGAFCPAGARYAYTAEHPSQPSELYACDPDGDNQVKVSDLNPWWRDRTPIQAEARQFTVPDGNGGQETIEGWLLRAEGRSGPYPLLNDVHGGPAAYALLDFDTNVFWQVLCSRGWAVLALNAVGSASYGREFCDRLQGRWGTLDLPQHLAAIEQLRRDGICDDRVTISGKSYGGYLSGWAIGHTNLFRAAVVMAPVGNIETHYGTSDGGYYADPLYMGTPEQFDRELARKLSPMFSIEKARTPTLFVQGKEDERCPKCQSEELFVSLLCAGDTPTELILYPGEGHTFLGEGKPSVRADAAQRIVDWLQKHVGQPVPPSDLNVIEDEQAPLTSVSA